MTAEQFRWLVGLIKELHGRVRLMGRDIGDETSIMSLYPMPASEAADHLIKKYDLKEVK